MTKVSTYEKSVTQAPVRVGWEHVGGGDVVAVELNGTSRVYLVGKGTQGFTLLPLIAGNGIPYYPNINPDSSILPKLLGIYGTVHVETHDLKTHV